MFKKQLNSKPNSKQISNQTSKKNPNYSSLSFSNSKPLPSPSKNTPSRKLLLTKSKSKAKNYEPEYNHNIGEQLTPYQFEDEEGENYDDTYDFDIASDELGPGMSDLPQKNKAFEEDYELRKESMRLFDTSGMTFNTPFNAADNEFDDEDSEFDKQEDSPVDDPYSPE